MERRRNTRPGVLQWTPAPLWISPATSVTPEDSWEDEDPKVDGFVKQMDENGIIGLSEALEDLKLEEACGYSGPSITEEAVPSGGGLKAWTEDWIARQSKNDHGRHFIMTEEEDEDHQGSKITRKRNEVPHTSAELEAREGLANCRFDRNPSENSNPDHMVSEPAVTASFLAHLYRFPEEELTAALGIEAETFPDMGFTETDSYCSQASVKSSPRCPETKPRASPLPTDVFCEQVELKDIPKRVLEKQKAGHSSEATCSLGGAKKDSLKLKQPDRKHPAGMNEFRALTSRHTPDFSKVEPRVYFPKRGYNPPRRKSSLTRTPLSPEPPMVFKSPADIVKEVLFNAPTDGSSVSADSNAPADVPNSMVPPEFMCPQQAMILLQQLQENYKKLLTKNAEAENTIDRLRLEAKVNLFSDPPKAGHFVHSGTSQHASNLLNLDFSPAQRAQICSHGQSSQQEKANPSPSTSRLGQQLSNLLFSQSEKFLQQLQTFDDLLKRDKLTSFEKLKGISQLSEGLNSLERGFLLARDEHKLLQQRGAETCNFDPERELEGLVFQCGLRMDELKEQVGNLQQVPQSSAASFPPSPPRSASSPDPPEEGEITHPHSQSISEHFQIKPSPAAEAEASLASERSDSDDEEETLKIIHQRPLISKVGFDEQEQTEPLQHDQTSKELSKLLKSPSCISLNNPSIHHENKEEWKGLRNGNDKVLETQTQRKVGSAHDSPPYPSSQHSVTRLAPSCSPSSARNRRRFERKASPSSMSSLTDAGSAWRNSEVQTGGRKAPPQDRIISPETDSGFVGSESSHLTPAAVPLLSHQRATESVSAPQDGSSKRQEPASLSPSHWDQEPIDGPTLDFNQRRRSRQRRPNLSYSPKGFNSQKKKDRTDDRSSDLLMSDSSTTRSNAASASEEQQSDPFTGTIASPLSSHSTSRPAASRRHGDSLRAPNSSQAGNHKDVLKTVQHEVDRLKEKLDSSPRKREPLSAVTAAPSAQKSCSHHNTSSPLIRECWSDVSLARRSTRSIDSIDQESVSCKPSRATTYASPKQQQQSHVLRRSDAEQQVSRCTQTSVAAHSLPTVDVRSRNTQTWMSPAPSSSDELDVRDQSLHCLQCSSVLRGPAEHCYRNHPSTDLNRQPTGSSDRASSRRYTAASVPPPALQYVPCYPPQFVLCPTPVYTSDIVDSRLMRRSKEKTGPRRRSHSDGHRSVDGSLDRAIRAAQNMKQTSRHMAFSLASGLQYHKLLTQSCSH